MVFAGSSSVYGDTAVLPKTETMPTNPLSPYALQKLMSEMYGQMFTRLYGLETVTTRYFNVFGPRQDPGSPYSGVISLFIKALHDGTRPIIYGDGEQTRDFTYVTNVVDGVIRSAETPGVGGQVFNVATNGRISLNELLAVLKKIFGSNLEPIYKEPRAGDVRDSQADISQGDEDARLPADRRPRRRAAQDGRLVQEFVGRPFTGRRSVRPPAARGRPRRSRSACRRRSRARRGGPCSSSPACRCRSESPVRRSRRD